MLFPKPIQLPDARLTRKSPFEEEDVSPYISPENPETTNVAEELRLEMLYWHYLNPVFIDAACGLGKTSFICGPLLDYVYETGDVMLVVANRDALNTQYKTTILEKRAPEVRKMFTAGGISQMREFEGVPVIFVNYQGLGAFINEYRNQPEAQKKIKWVILDEVHYFCADSFFTNEDTYKLLRQIPKVFKECIRIYCTATPWVVRNVIASVEEETPPPILNRLNVTFGGYVPLPRSMIYYNFPDVHRNYELHFFPAEMRAPKNCGELCSNLIKLRNDGEKAVVFVDSKQIGKAIHDALPRSIYLDQDSKEKREWNSLIENQKFDADYLIATAVIDSGININDPTVKHIIIFSDDHVQAIQELGRRRFIKNEVVHVYFVDLSVADIKRRLDRDLQLLGDLDKFEHSPPEQFALRKELWFAEEPARRHLITVGYHGTLSVNRCAEYKLHQCILFYMKLLREHENGDAHPFATAVCRWLNIDQDSSDVDWVNSSKEEKEKKVRDFLEAQVGSELTKGEAQDGFANQFRNLCNAAYGKREKSHPTRPWKARTISSVLNEHQLPYVVEANKKTKVWIIKRKELDSKEDSSSDSSAPEANKEVT